MAEYSYNFQERNISPNATPEDIEKNWLWALIGYFGPLFFVALAIRSDSVFAKYHARQGMGLFIAEIFWLFLWIVVNFAVPAEIKFAFLVVTTIFTAGLIGILVLLTEGIVNSLRGVMKPVDIIGKYFEEK